MGEGTVPGRRGRRRPVVAAAVVLGLAGLAAVVAARGVRRGPAGAAELPTPYRNARPGVRYVGDAACTRCHAEIAATYARHPMGRSLAPIADAPEALRGGPEPRPLFTAHGFEYSDERRGGETVHRETRRASDGRVVGQVEGVVKYVLGSGTRARAFLIERDGYLFQSPVTWYAQGGRWDLAPTYDHRDDRFDRQITPGCLVCHANGFDHVAGTEGRYRPPVFPLGHAVGCERCHGPGEVHVREASATGPGGPNVVNPKTLTPALRDAVCEQCHLLGKATIARYGRALQDYRPGLPLHKFVTVFVRSGGRPGDHPNADHVEQMALSRCAEASGGKLACTSCHDPHAVPAPEEKVAYYRTRCLACHADKGCAEPAEARRARQPDDSCVACHMPRATTTDVPHVATTLHRIPRRPEPTPAPPPDDDPTALVPFHRALMDDSDRREADRDLGVALRHRGEAGAAKALPLLEKAVADRPDDALAAESVGFALGGLGRNEQALAAFASLLEREPRRESALEAAALIAGGLRKHEDSVGYWRRAIGVDPWRSSFHAGLAFQLTRLRRWPEAADAARGALALNPSNSQARSALILATLRQGDARAARAEFDTLLGFDPPDRDGLEAWYQSLGGGAGGAP